MTPHPRLWISAATFALACLVGCKPAPESVRVKEPVGGPPDLVQNAAPNPANHSYQLRAFHLNHVWAQAGGHSNPATAYRAKITVWDYAEDESAVAELYFEDAPSAASNPDPNKTSRPYKLHFPVSAMSPILGTLRNTNEPIFLYYYEGAWAVGTYMAEPVGVD